MKVDAIALHAADNVATAVQDLVKNGSAKVRLGEEILEIFIAQDIPYGHKFSIKAIVKGEPVLKYGEVIGAATEDIPVGTHAHIHNIESMRGRGDLRRGG